MEVNDQNSLVSYLKTLVSDQRNSLLGLRQVRKIETFDGKVIPRQYLEIQRQLNVDK